MKKKLQVSIGTSAYNEEHNINNLLESVINQKGKTITIKEIIVISDGSTDNTVRMAKSVHDARIKVINDGKRMSQPMRINQLLKMFRGDVLIIVDSDMVMQDKNTLENIVEKFVYDKTTALVCGEIEPLPARTFLESAINNYIYVRKSLEKEFCFGDTAYGAHAFLAFSKKFAQTLEIPKGIINGDAYCYFMCISKAYTHYFAKDAVAFYRSPSSIRDHMNQSTRHLAGGLQLKKYFGADMIDKGFFVPKKILIKVMLGQFIRNPAKYVFLKILNLYCGFRSKKVFEKLDAKWTTIESSKRVGL